MAEASRIGVFLTQANHGFGRGDPVSFDGETWAIASTGSAGVGIVGSIVDANTFEFVTHGELDGLDGLTPGATYYVVDGELSTTESGIAVGFATSDTTLFVQSVSIGSTTGGGGGGDTFDHSILATQTQLVAAVDSEEARAEEAYLDVPADTGIVVHTGNTESVTREIVTDATIDITDGDGVAGNPTLTRAAISGDVVIAAGSNDAVVQPNAIENTMLAQMPTLTLKGNDDVGTADPQDLTAAEAKALLDIQQSDVQDLVTDLTAITGDITTLQGDVTAVEGDVATLQGRLITANSPITGGGDLSADRSIGFDQTIDLDNNARVAVSKAGVAVGERRRLNFIEGSNVTLTIADDAGNEEVDITVASTGGGGVSDGDKGDITVSGSGATWTVDNDAITFAKIQNVASGVLLGSVAGGDIEEISLNGAGLEFSGLALQVTSPYSFLREIIPTPITGADTALDNHIYAVSGTSADYDITLPVAPDAGTVVGFYVKDWTAANKQYRLDAGGTVKIAGRTRYLVLLHTNVVLLQFDGTDWLPLVLCLDTPWIDAGAITVTAVTTNPTKGTVSTDEFHWRRVGDSCEVRVNYYQTTAGTTGSGQYRLAIPFAYDTAKLTRLAEGSNKQVADARAGFGVAAIQDVGSFDTVGVLYANTSGATYLSIATLNGPGTAAYNWSSGSLAFNTVSYGIRAEFTYPVANW